MSRSHLSRFIRLVGRQSDPLQPYPCRPLVSCRSMEDGREGREGQPDCASRCGFVHAFFEALRFFVVHCKGVSTSSPRAARCSQRELRPSLRPGLTLTMNGPAPGPRLSKDVDQWWREEHIQYLSGPADFADSVAFIVIEVYWLASTSAGQSASCPRALHGSSASGLTDSAR
jgi:hypothetical protein